MIIASITYVSAKIFSSNWNIEYRREGSQTPAERDRIMHQAIQGWMTITRFKQFFYESSHFNKSVDSALKGSAQFNQRWAVG
jgi:ABC-type transport system involved in Fe-S cluster assembly fused permease/ATPase subunit